ncbi:MAG: preprotein translocase subunit SecA [Candidatus Omnitrophica bacterium CG23_combo_of_CG06-09_8_20_14_all_40_11]|nr:MAG: preprotein translocase subunit SecA [Candidatus Omnitrophica bacterium CG23_combo_of_CG06-09_8_20_14_all_40_11]
MVGLAKIVNAVNSLEPKISALSDMQLRRKTEEFKEHILKKSKVYESEILELEEALLSVAIPEEKEKIKEKLKITRNKIFEDILPEGFAAVREAAKRTVNMRHFDVQIAGGIVLHEGKIAEMATGEGKTLVATLPAYLNALFGRGVHIVTVNDYLARRDREWMGPIYEFLGLTVGVIQHDMSDEQRKQAYACDITYGTNNEFGFDYLRDNMKYSLEDLAQRPFYYAIVDEVDSILIDEARTPLIISGPAEESTEKYYIIDKIIPRLKIRKILEKDEIDAKYKGQDLSKGFDAIVDEKAHTAYLTEEGEPKVCVMLNIDNLHDIETMEWRHHIIQGLRAHNLYKKDVDYVIKDGQVIIVDEFTGRMMPGRRWSDGLHQAVEAKEGLKIERENQTLATITFQNYFRMYEKLAGMTGTALTEANEFKSIYQLDVVTIPTNRTLIRTNYPDSVYKTEEEKFNAVVGEIAELYNLGRPVLVGTITIDKSERLSDMLKRRGVPHQVLNAKYHEMEAQIVAQAGRYKGVTIATNMAGRGTDILLGGNPEFMAKNLAKQKLTPPLHAGAGLKPDDPNYQEEYKKLLEQYRKETDAEHKKVVELGGLHVLGTERHEARRIDNQLRGRSGRQGDPGSSRFYVSFEDDLMRLFAPDWMLKLLDKVDTQGEPLTLKEGNMANMVSKSIETAQRRVEQHNFEIRKQLLEYDNVMNKQREVIYGQRRFVLEGVSLKEEILDIIDKIIGDILAMHINDNVSPEEWDIAGLVSALKLKFNIEIDTFKIEKLNKGQIKEKFYQNVIEAYEEKERAVGPDMMRHLERMVFLQIIDSKWKDHLYAMDNLREGIGLRAYGQRDPLVEYKREAFEMFSQMITGIEEEAVETIFRLQAAKPERFRGVFSSVSQEFLHPETSRFEKPEAEPAIEPGHRFGLPQPVTIAPTIKSHPKVGRNDPCPCGKIDSRTGKPLKYKKCCGR